MEAGFDKFVLTTKDFMIKDISLFGVNRNIPQGKKETEMSVISIDNGTTEMINMRANSVYFNHELFNFTVNRTGAQIIFNPSKILHPYELVTDFKEVQKVSNRINDLLKQNSILLNLDNCTMSRIDLAKQQIMSKSIYSYRPAFDFMKGKRMKNTGYEGGYRWGNNTHEVTMYDKGTESNLPISNLERCEAKFKKTKFVQNKTGFLNYGQLFKSDNQYINSVYNNYLDSTIFRNNVGHQLVLDFQTELDKLIHFKSSGRNAVLKFLASSNLTALINKFGSIEVIFDLMKEAGFDKASISRERKNIKDLLPYGEITQINVNTLIHELRQTFAA